MSEVKFIVPGTPQGKGRARSTMRKRRDGIAIAAHYTPAKTRAYEQSVSAAAHRAMLGKPLFSGPVSLMITAFFEPPKSWPKWKREAALLGDIKPTGKPDLDNILKAIKDGLNGEVWKDDSQVVSVGGTKTYSEEAGVYVHARTMRGVSSSASREEYEAIQNAER